MPVTLEEYQRGLPIGESAYLDANFIISALNFSLARPPEPKYLLAELLRDQVVLMVSPLTMDEVWWTVLRALNERDGYRNFIQRYKSNPQDHLEPYLPELRAGLGKLTRWPSIRWVGSGTDGVTVETCVLRSLDNISNFHLAPRDAFHLHYATLHSASAFITGDSDFDALEGVEEFDLLVVKTP